MPVYELQKGGKTYEVDAPSPQAAGDALARMLGETPQVPPMAPEGNRLVETAKKINQFDRDLRVGAVKGVAKTVLGLGELVHKVPGVRRAVDAVYGQPGLSEQAFTQGREAVQPTTTGEKVGFGAERIAEFMVPLFTPAKMAAGATTSARLLNLGKNVGKQGADFALKTAAQTGGDPEDIMSAALWGAAVPAVVGLGKAAKSVAAEKLPERLYGQIFRLAEDDLQKAYQTAARGQKLDPTLAKEMLDRGLRGSSRNMAVYSIKKLDALESDLKHALVGKFVRLPQKQDYLRLLDDIATEMGGAFAKTGAQAKALHLKLKSGIRGPYVSASDALTLKRFLDSARNTSSFRMSAKLSPKQDEFKEAADLVRRTIHGSFPNASKLLNEERVFIQGIDSIVGDAVRRSNRRLLGLTDYVLGGGGMASGYGVAGPGAAALVRGFQNPFTLTNLGYLLNRIGRAAPPPSVGTFGGAAGAVATRQGLQEEEELR